MGGGRRRHPLVKQSTQQKWQLWQLWLWQENICCGGGDERVLGDSGVDVEAEGVADGVADGVVDGEDLVVGKSVLVQRDIRN